MVASSREVVADAKAMNGEVSEIRSKVIKYQSEDMDGYRRLAETSTDDTAEVLLVCRGFGLPSKCFPARSQAIRRQMLRDHNPHCE